MLVKDIAPTIRGKVQIQIWSADREHASSAYLGEAAGVPACLMNHRVFEVFGTAWCMTIVRAYEL